MTDEVLPSALPTTVTPMGPDRVELDMTPAVTTPVTTPVSAPVVMDTAVVSVAPVPSAVAVVSDSVTVSHTASTEPNGPIAELPPATSSTAALSAAAPPVRADPPPPSADPAAEPVPSGSRGTDSPPTAKAIGPAPPIDAGDVLVAAADLVIGTAWWATGPLRAVGRLGIQAVEAGLAGATARSRRLQLRAQAHRGDARSTLDLFIQALLRPIIKRVVDAALAELDLTKIVIEHVDLNRVAAALDIDGIVAGVDLDAAVARVDLDAAVARVDLDAAVRRVDLDQIVGRIDVDGIVASVDIAAVVDRVDIESIVNRLDLDEIAGRLDVDGIVAKVDLTAIVDRLDIAAVVARVDPDPVVARVNFDAAMSHIDLIGIAQRVVDGIDLPGIIRESTGSLATEAVAGVRVQGQAADDAVGQLVGRVLRRRALDPPRHQ